MADKGFQMVRYADDFVILCRTESEAVTALEEVRTWVAAVGLTLHPDKTHIVDSREKSFALLGLFISGTLSISPGEESQEVARPHSRADAAQNG